MPILRGLVVRGLSSYLVLTAVLIAQAFAAPDGKKAETQEDIESERLQFSPERIICREGLEDRLHPFANLSIGTRNPLGIGASVFARQQTTCPTMETRFWAIGAKTQVLGPQHMEFEFSKGSMGLISQRVGIGVSFDPVFLGNHLVACMGARFSLGCLKVGTDIKNGPYIEAVLEFVFGASSRF